MIKYYFKWADHGFKYIHIVVQPLEVSISSSQRKTLSPLKTDFPILSFPLIPGNQHSTFYFYEFDYALIGEGNGTPLQYSCLENPMDGGAW